MCAATTASADLAARLTEELLPVVARYTPGLPSVEVELALWHALGDALRVRPRRDGAAHLADAAYRALLPLHPAGSFLDLELSLYREVRAAQAV